MYQLNSILMWVEVNIVYVNYSYEIHLGVVPKEINVLYHNKTLLRLLDNVLKMLDDIL